MNGIHEDNNGEGARKAIDLLPEQTGYRDDGCYIHPKCLTCPLPRCIYDESDGGRAMLKEMRDQELLKVYRKEGLDVAKLAERFGISRRSVYRIISQNKASKKDKAQSA